METVAETVAIDRSQRSPMGCLQNRCDRSMATVFFVYFNGITTVTIDLIYGCGSYFEILSLILRFYHNLCLKCCDLAGKNATTLKISIKKDSKFQKNTDN